ncbi:hypothetical protein R5R35_001334 [Gryllus longicercus]|uniref:Uncharacterized protein n=1 Tax=Gryllus longicercus TaxID=2509291 RepID=A0AAN9Z484_9ORTH
MSRKRRAEERSRSRSPSSRSSSRSSQSHGSQDDEEDGIRLHVAGLGFGIRRRELQHIFEKYGDLREIWMARSPPCFAFVVYREKDDAEDAVKATDGIMLHGNQLRVTFARPRTRGRGRRGFDPNMRCYQCGYKGHFSRDCPDTKYGYKRPPSRYGDVYEDNDGYPRNSSPRQSNFRRSSYRSERSGGGRGEGRSSRSSRSHRHH